MLSPLIHKFEAGYRAGVKHVCPECEVIAQYAGVTPEAFRNPGRGKELALAQYQSGVNVMLMDGSVRFVRNSIPLATWRALGTRAGNEVIGDF